MQGFLAGGSLAPLPFLNNEGRPPRPFSGVGIIATGIPRDQAVDYQDFSSLIIKLLRAREERRPAPAQPGRLEIKERKGEAGQWEQQLCLRD